MTQEINSAALVAAKQGGLRRQPRKPVGVGSQQQEMIDKSPILYRGTLERAYRHTASPMTAIKAKCLDCCDYDRGEITACQVLRCPLHAYRPYQKTG